MISPVHLFSHAELGHVRLRVQICKAVLEVLRKTVDSTVGKRRVRWIEGRIAHILKASSFVKCIRPELYCLNSLLKLQ